MISAARGRIALALLALSLTAACGLKGPLYLPDRSAQAETPTAEEEVQTPRRRTQSQKHGGTQPPPVTSDPDRSATPPPPK